MQSASGTIGSRIFSREEKLSGKVECPPLDADADLPAGAVQEPRAEEGVAPAEKCKENGRKGPAQASYLDIGAVARSPRLCPPEPDLPILAHVTGKLSAFAGLGRPDTGARVVIRSHRPLLLVAAVFVVSRAAAYIAGIRFDVSSLDYFWQYLDPLLLKTRLLESVFYLHSQPPLFNLLLGVGLKLAPGHFGAAMHIAYSLLGLLLSLALYLVLMRIGVRRWPSAVVAALLSATPAFLLYENWLFYEYPVATLLLLSVLALSEFLWRGSLWSGTAFFVLVALVVYIRAIFQPPWLILVIALLLVARPDLRRKVVATSALPTLAVLLLVVKNLVVFGLPTTSSWFGMNLVHAVYHATPEAERRQLVERRKLSRASLTPPFSPPADYLQLVPPPSPTGVPALDQLWKSGGRPNMNSKIMVKASRSYFGDALYLIRTRPNVWARAIVREGRVYLRPTTDAPFVFKNRSKIDVYNDLVDRYVLLDFSIGWTTLAAHVLALLYGLRLTYRLLRRRIAASVASITLAYVWLTLAVGTVVIMFTPQVNENNRVRFFLDPLVVILVALPIGGGVRLLAQRLITWRST